MKAYMCVLSVLLVLLVKANCFLKPFEARQYPLEKGANPGKALILTPLIKAGKIKQAQKKSTVTPLVGNINSYSGFLTTNAKCGNNLFFWFFPAQQDWENAPLVLWLQGGPGAPSSWGLFEELGPFNSFEDGLQMRNHSWNVRNNLLFIDQPAGTGFSFTKKKCYAENETVVGEELYSAITQFLTLFPNLQQNKFFIAGESYGGHYVPAIGYTILKNNPSAALKINLNGLMIGDGLTDPREQINYADYTYQLGLIDDELRDQMYIYQKQFVTQVDAEQWGDAVDSMNSISEIIDENAGVSEYYYLPQPDDKSNWIEFVQRTSTRKAIHVGAQPFSNLSMEVYNHLLLDIPKSVKPWVEQILEEIPILFYAGQLDIICAYPMVVNFVRSLNWSGQEVYLNASRRIWYEGQDIAGYVRGEYRLFDVMVRGAGHMVPQDQPLWAYQLINSFVWGKGIFYGKV